VIAQLASSGEEWIVGVQAARQLGERYGADRGFRCVRGNGAWRVVNNDGRVEQQPIVQSGHVVARYLSTCPRLGYCTVYP
jgi:hypothetical protein